MNIINFEKVDKPEVWRGGQTVIIGFLFCLILALFDALFAIFVHG